MDSKMLKTRIISWFPFSLAVQGYIESVAVVYVCDKPMFS